MIDIIIAAVSGGFAVGAVIFFGAMLSQMGRDNPGKHPML